MKKQNLGDIQASRISLGMMRASKLNYEDYQALVLKAIESGINFFDHADIYGKGKSETLFGDFLTKNPDLRSKIYIQTKCGIRQGFYDCSYEHIINSVKQSLLRLKTNYIDVLLLHRPDTLCDPQEIARAFQYLKDKELIRLFGVSNMNSMQVELLQKNIDFKLIINQLQLSIVHAGIIKKGFYVNMNEANAYDCDGSILEFSRLNNITIQAWSVLQASWEEGTFLNNSKYQKLNKVLNDLSMVHGVSPAAIAVAWILRHPAQMQAIIGTTSIKHLQQLVKANDVILTKEEWYKLYTSAHGLLP